MSGIADSLTSIFEGIANLPSLIVEGIKDIFVPDTEYIDTAFKGFVEEMKTQFNFDTTFFDSLFTGEQPVTDTYMDYQIPGVGNFNLKVFDTKYLVSGVEYFRPFIRGFLVLMMVLYHIRQLVGFFGYNAGVVPGRNEAIKSAREG